MATYLRFGGVVNNYIKTGLLLQYNTIFVYLYLFAECVGGFFFLKSVNICKVTSQSMVV